VYRVIFVEDRMRVKALCQGVWDVGSEPEGWAGSVHGCGWSSEGEGGGIYVDVVGNGLIDEAVRSDDRSIAATDNQEELQGADVLIHPDEIGWHPLEQLLQ
jgi:hypothetical protein